MARDVSKSFIPPKLAAAPASPALGAVYYNTTDNKLYLWNGAWQDLAATGSGGSGGTVTFASIFKVGID